MNFVITKNLFENVLTNMQPFLEKKDATLITSHILFSIENKQLVVQATDYEIGLRATIDNLEDFHNGKATVNGKKILDIVRRLQDGKIKIETNGNFLKITQKSSSFKLPMFNSDEFPEFESNFNKSRAELNGGELIKAIKQITPAIDTNNPKFELNGALIDMKEDKINIVSTDTRRLALVQLNTTSHQELSMIIPKKAIVEMQKLFFDDIEIFYDNIALVIKSKQYEFFTKLTNGKFPDYERIIPKACTNSLTLPKEQFIQATKIITSISNNIKLSFTHEGIKFESLSDENSEAQTNIEINTLLESETYLALNSKFILDFLGSIDESEFTIKFSEPNLPFVLESNTLKTIVMPIVL